MSRTAHVSSGVDTVANKSWPKTLSAGALGIALVAGWSLTTTEPAAAEVAEEPPSPRCTFGVCDDNGGHGDARQGYLSVNVWGSTTTAGEDSYEIPGNTVWSRPPCYYFELPDNGQEAYAKRSSYLGGHTGGAKWTLEMLEEYKDEDEGNWWDTRCIIPDVSLDEAIEFAENNPVTYVFPGDPFPVPEIPPEFLLEVAHDALELPAPEVSWNPRRQGDGATLVNLPTWFWLDDGPIELEVNAEAAGNRATVDAALSEMGFSAATAEPVTCDGFGTAWAPEATSDCFLEFRRSSANRPGQVTPVQAESHWSVEWSFNDELQGPLDSQSTLQEFLVPVAEVQSRVTG